MLLTELVQVQLLHSFSYTRSLTLWHARDTPLPVAPIHPQSPNMRLATGTATL
jgi:hypothetical protein